MESLGNLLPNFTPLFRGTVPLMGHSLASATLGLVGSPGSRNGFRRQLVLPALWVLPVLIW